MGDGALQRGKAYALEFHQLTQLFSVRQQLTPITGSLQPKEHFLHDL
jgi:hypothetical protein